MSNSFVIGTAADGNTPIRYSCQELMDNNKATQLNVQYYYDILHDSSANEATVVAKGESDLLSKVATHFGIIDGARCSIPPVNDLWIIQVSSKPEDTYVNGFDSCQLLVPKTGQTCSVYKGHMEAYYLGGGDPSELESFIQENLGSLGTNENYEVAYLGSQLDTGAVDAGSASGNMTAPAPVNKAERSVQPNNRGKRTVTFVGGLLVAGFLAAFLGLFFVLYRRRQKFLAAQDVEIALSKSDLDTDDASLRNRRDNSRGMRPNGELEIGDEYDDDYGNGNYTFDLGSNMKNELFNIHGRAGDAPRQYGIGIEETSDSDNDSWAQTDGTITEIETCLEPITAEI